jgi:hypothetical protein
VPLWRANTWSKLAWITEAFYSLKFVAHVKRPLDEDSSDTLEPFDMIYYI